MEVAEKLRDNVLLIEYGTGCAGMGCDMGVDRVTDIVEENIVRELELVVCCRYVCFV